MKTKFLLSFLLMFTFGASIASAVCVDNDKDRYYSECVDEAEMKALMGARGMEAERCDQVLICDVNDTACTASSNPSLIQVYNSDIAGTGGIAGNKVNPGAIEKINNGIDEDCNGQDGTALMGDDGDSNLMDLVQTATKILGTLIGIISVLIVTWGGIMWSTAAGDDEKISKAKKTIIGSLIGAIIGFSAPAIVSYFIDKFAS